MCFQMLLVLNLILFTTYETNVFGTAVPSPKAAPETVNWGSKRYEEWDQTIPIGTCANLVRLLDNELEHLITTFPEKEKDQMTSSDCDPLRELVLYTPNCARDDEDVVNMLIKLKDSGYCQMDDRIVIESRQPFGNWSVRTATVQQILILLMVTFVCVCYFAFGVESAV